MLQCVAPFGLCASVCANCALSPMISVIGCCLTVTSLAYLVSSARDEQKSDGILPLYRLNKDRWDKSQLSTAENRKSTAKLCLVIGLLLLAPFGMNLWGAQSQETYMQPLTPTLECRQVRAISSGLDGVVSVTCPMDHPFMTGCSGFTPDRHQYHGDIAVRTSSTTCSAFSTLSASSAQTSNESTTVWASAQCCRLLHSQKSVRGEMKTEIVRSTNSQVFCPVGTTLLGCTSRGHFESQGTDYVRNGCHAIGADANHIIKETSALCGSMEMSPEYSSRHFSIEMSCVTVSGFARTLNETVEATCPVGYEMTDCSAWNREPVRGSFVYGRLEFDEYRNRTRQVCAGLARENSTSKLRVSARCCHVIPIDTYDSL